MKSGIRRQIRRLWLAALALVLSCEVLVTGCAQLPADSAEPSATIDTGQLRGARIDGVLAFRGVPYARPPVGALRWRAPQPAPATLPA